MCAAHNLVRGEERITQVGRNEDLDEEDTRMALKMWMWTMARRKEGEGRRGDDVDDVDDEHNDGDDLHLVFAGRAGHIEDHRPAEARS